MILGNVLILGKYQHFFFREADLSGPRQAILRRLLGADEFITPRDSFFFSIGPLQIRDQHDRNLREQRGNRRRKRRNGLFQIFL